MRSTLCAFIALSIATAISLGSPPVRDKKPRATGPSPYLYIVPQDGASLPPTELFTQPNGPFCAVIFHEDALGTLLGLIYYRAMTNPADGRWKIDDRFWQDETWAFD